MTKKVIAILFSLLIIFLIVACGGSIITILRVGDIIAVANYSDLVIYADAKLEIETFGLDDETDIKIKLIEWFRATKNFGSRTGDFSTYLTADIEVPIVNYYNDYFYLFDDPFSILLYDAGDRIYISFVFNDLKFDEIDNYIQDNYYSSLSLEDWNFTINLYNDTKQEQSVILNYVYANGEALLFEELFRMEPKEIIDLKISDLLRDFAKQEGFSTFGQLLR